MKLQMLILVSFIVVECHISEHSWGNPTTDNNFTCPLNDEISPCMCTTVSPIPSIHCDHVRSLKTVNGALKDAFRNKTIPFLKIQYAHFVGLPSRAFVEISMVRMQIKDSNLRYVAADAFAGLEALMILILHNVKLLTFPSESLNQLSSLISLYLPSNRLSLLSHEDLRIAGGLKYLSLEQNQLTHVTRGSFPVSLVTLSLSGNRLFRLDRAISNLPNLEWLFLNNNWLIDIEGDLDGLYSLTHLNVANNRITTLGNSLKNLIKLDSVDLQHNKMRRIGRSLRNQRQLKKLNLAVNLLHKLKYGDFLALTALERLDLARNKLEHLNGALRHLSSLITLDLSHNALQHFSFWEISTLHHLKVLDISDNNLIFLRAEPGMLTISSTSIIFARNQLADLGHFFSHFPHLEELDISCNNLRTIKVADFTHSPGMTYINVQENPLICDAEQMDVYRMLRNLRIEVDGEPRCAIDPPYL